MTAPPDRHLTVDSFSSYLGLGKPIHHPVPGSPRLVLFVDPDTERIGLYGPAQPPGTLPATGLRHLTVNTVVNRGQRLTEIAITHPTLFIDAYPVLCAIADRVQLDGQSVGRAVTDTLHRLGHLLRPDDTLSTETEVGLFGELLLLTGLSVHVGLGTALAAWLGDSAEQHDFAVAGHDIEVKTTASEKRQHWITNLEQLVPTGQRPLSLVSFQITRAGTDGRTLADVITRLRGLSDAPAERGALDTRLRDLGWRDRFADAGLHHWRLRSPPATYAVTDDFPRLTPPMLARSGADVVRIVDVRYRIDLAGLPTCTPPPLIEQALATAAQEIP